MVVDLAGGLLALGGSTAAFAVGAVKPHIAVKAGVYGMVTAAGIRGRNEYQLWRHRKLMRHDQLYHTRWQEMNQWERSDAVYGKFGGTEAKLKYIGALTVVMAGGCVLGGACGWTCRYGVNRWRNWRDSL